MMRKSWALVLATMLILAMCCGTSLAATLELNGSAVNPARESLVIRDGFSYISVTAFNRLMGSDLITGNNQSFSLIKNEDILYATLNSTAATMNGAPLELPRAPYKTASGEIMLPLKAVFNLFGAQVDWDASRLAIVISFTETRDGLTPEQWLGKSSLALQSINSYQASGTMNMSMHLSGINNAQVPDQIDLANTMDMYYQSTPLNLYIRQEMESSTIAAIPDMTQPVVTENLFKDGYYYINTPQTGWVKMTIPGLDLNDMIEKYSRMDPAGLLEEMKQMGFACTFGNDVTIGNVEYIVIHVNVDMDKMLNRTSDLMSSYGATTASMGIIDQFVNDSEFIIYERMFINKDSLLTDSAELYSYCKINMPNPDNPQEKVGISMDMTGDFSYHSFGETMNLPDVSGAVDMPVN